MRGETVAQSAYLDWLLQTSGFTGLATSFYRGVITDRLFRMLAGEEPGLRSFALPIATQDSQQGRRKHHVAIFPTFALTYPDDHAAGVNIRDLQMCDFRYAQTGSVNSHQECQILWPAHRVKELLHFLLTEHHWEPLSMPWISNLTDGPVALERNAIEKPQGADYLNEITQRDAALVDQIYLVLTNLFGPQQLRRFAEVAGEVSNAGDVSFDGVRGSITYFQIIDQALTKSGHAKAPFTGRMFVWLQTLCSAGRSFLLP